MMPEARSELEQARASLATTAAARRPELDAHDLALSLLGGDYARAAVLMGTDAPRFGVERDWLPGFLLRRELGFNDEDEADIQARATPRPGLVGTARIGVAAARSWSVGRGQSNRAG